MKNSTKKSLELKPDVRIAYIKLFGKEKGLELIKEAETKKKKMYETNQRRLLRGNQENPR